MITSNAYSDPLVITKVNLITKANTNFNSKALFTQNKQAYSVTQQ